LNYILSGDAQSDASELEHQIDVVAIVLSQWKKRSHYFPLQVHMNQEAHKRQVIRPPVGNAAGSMRAPGASHQNCLHLVEVTSSDISVDQPLTIGTRNS
jgi:hypothetical protein